MSHAVHSGRSPLARTHFQKPVCNAWVRLWWDPGQIPRRSKTRPATRRRTTYCMRLSSWDDLGELSLSLSRPEQLSTAETPVRTKLVSEQLRSSKFLLQ